jgi:hypothetical protein
MKKPTLPPDLVTLVETQILDWAVFWPEQIKWVPQARKGGRRKLAALRRIRKLLPVAFSYSSVLERVADGRLDLSSADPDMAFLVMCASREVRASSILRAFRAADPVPTTSLADLIEQYGLQSMGELGAKVVLREWYRRLGESAERGELAALGPAHGLSALEVKDTIARGIASVAGALDLEPYEPTAPRVDPTFRGPSWGGLAPTQVLPALDFWLSGWEDATRANLEAIGARYKSPAAFAAEDLTRPPAHAPRVYDGLMPIMAMLVEHLPVKTSARYVASRIATMWYAYEPGAELEMKPEQVEALWGGGINKDTPRREREDKLTEAIRITYYRVKKAADPSGGSVHVMKLPAR